MLTGGALFVAYEVFRPFLTSLFLALVLTIAFLPVHEWIARRVRRPNIAAMATTITVVFVILVPLVFIGIKLSTEATNLYGLVSRQGGAWSSGSVWVSEAVERVAQRTGTPSAQLKSAISTRVQKFGAGVVGMVEWAARGLAQQITTALLTFLALFFFLRDRKEFSIGIANLLPLPPQRVQQLMATLDQTIMANIYGMCAVGLIQGILTALGFWITGLRAPLFWGAIATILSFVPLVGPALVWIPGGIALGLQGNWVKAAVLFVWGSVMISSVDYIVRPRIARGAVSANTLLVLLSFLGGVRAFGAIGIIAGPVILSMVTALLSMLREEQPIAFMEQEQAQK